MKTSVTHNHEQNVFYSTLGRREYREEDIDYVIYICVCYFRFFQFINYPFKDVIKCEFLF